MSDIVERLGNEVRFLRNEKRALDLAESMDLARTEIVRLQRDLKTEAAIAEGMLARATTAESALAEKAKELETVRTKIEGAVFHLADQGTIQEIGARTVMRAAPTLLLRALAGGNRLATLVDAVKKHHGESFEGDALEALDAWRAVERRLRESIPPPVGSHKRTSRRRELLGRLRPGTDDNVFVPLLPSDTPHTARRRLYSASRYHGWRLRTSFLTEDGVDGLRVWRLT